MVDLFCIAAWFFTWSEMKVVESERSYDPLEGTSTMHLEKAPLFREASLRWRVVPASKKAHVHDELEVRVRCS